MYHIHVDALRAPGSGVIGGCDLPYVGVGT